MKAFIVLAAIVASASAGVILSSPITYSNLALTSHHLALSPIARTVVAAPSVAIAPAATATQYHAQNELKEYSYGYAGGPSAKAETKTADGVTRGQYSYNDANGILQTTSYVSDALGFRVAATNLPVGPVAAPAAVLPGPIPQQVQDTPEVAAARAAHLDAVAKAAAAAEAAPDN